MERIRIEIQTGVTRVSGRKWISLHVRVVNESRSIRTSGLARHRIQVGILDYCFDLQVKCWRYAPVTVTVIRVSEEKNVIYWTFWSGSCVTEIFDIFISLWYNFIPTSSIHDQLARFCSDKVNPSSDFRSRLSCIAWYWKFAICFY